MRVEIVTNTEDKQIKLIAQNPEDRQ